MIVSKNRIYSFQIAVYFGSYLGHIAVYFVHTVMIVMTSMIRHRVRYGTYGTYVPYGTVQNNCVPYTLHH